MRPALKSRGELMWLAILAMGLAAYAGALVIAVIPQI